jgi:hypothetical protein
MAEPLFGSMAQPWSSNPTFGYLQTPMPFVNRPAPIGTFPFQTLSPPAVTLPQPTVVPSPPMTSAMPGIGSPAINAGLSAVMSAPATSGIPSSGEITVGVTAPTLVAAIAVRRGQPLGPSNDVETEDFICDALDMLPGAGDVEVRCESGRALLTGTVPHKRLKRDVGEIAWAIPSVNDVQNNVTIASRRRVRSSSPTTRESEAPSMAGAGGRKQP